LGAELRAASLARRRQNQQEARSMERQDIMTRNRHIPLQDENVEVIFNNLERIYEESMRGPIQHDEL